MQRLSTAFVVAAITILVPTLALAGNQQIADEIAYRLRDSGQLHNYDINVKYQNGTAWLEGRVPSQEQMNAALKLAFQTRGVNRVVNSLTVASGPAASPTQNTFKAMQASRPQQGVQPASLQAESIGPSFGPQAGPLASTPRIPRSPIPVAYTQFAGEPGGRPIPAYVPGTGGGVAPAQYDQPCMPDYAWPSYAAYPNYAAVTYPRQYSPTAWPFIGPFYPYPQVPLGWRKVTLEWDDGWWMLDFKD